MIHLFCAVCDADACYGEGPPLRGDERWYCRAHVPDGFLPGKRGAQPGRAPQVREETPKGQRQGSLF